MNESSHRRPLWRRILGYLFIASWILLLFWAIPTVRIEARFAVLNLLGFSSGLAGHSIPETIALQEYHPATVYVPQGRHELDHPKFPVFEFHGHIFPRFRDDIKGGFKKTRTAMFVDLAVLTRTATDLAELQKKYPQREILFFPAWNWNRLKESNDAAGIAKMTSDLEEMAKMGVKGVKLWKDFGLMRRRADGSLYRMDDRDFDPLWDVAAKYHLVIAIHSADPPAFFQKVDGSNERFEEIARRPEWSFEKGPSFDDLMTQREHMFERRRDVRFVALHFGEFGHDLKRAAALLDRNPNVWLDTAQRIDELGRHPRETRNFFIKYQDRILFGTDGPPDYEKDRIYWRFFETGDEYFDYYPSHKDRKGFWKISGIELPDEILKKIYYRNALSLLGIPEAEFLANDPAR